MASTAKQRYKIGKTIGISKLCLESTSKVSPSAITDTTYETTTKGYGRADMGKIIVTASK